MSKQRKQQKRMRGSRVTVMPALPRLVDHLVDLERDYKGVMKGRIPLDRARLGLGLKKQAMRKNDYVIQWGRMDPSIRPHLGRLLGLSDMLTLEAATTPALGEADVIVGTNKEK